MTTGEERPAPIIAWLVPSVGVSIFLLAVGVTLFGTTLFRDDGDVGRHIRIGRDILDTLHIPRIDQYSHTMAGTPVVPYEWLSETLFAISWSSGPGLAGVVVLTGLLFATASWFAYRIARIPGPGPVLAGAAAVIALALQTGHLLPRPHLFTTLLAAVFLFLLESFRRERRDRYLFALPPVMLLWANLHGGFLVGFILLGVYLLDSWRSRTNAGPTLGRLLAATTGCLAVTFLTPAGPAIWAHTTGYLGIDFLVDMTHEYQSPDFHSGYGRAFLLAILLGFALLAGGRAGATFIEALLFAGWLAAALHSARNIPLFGVLAVPWFAAWTQRTLVSLAAEGRGGRFVSRILGFDHSAASTDALLRPALGCLLGLTAIFGLAFGTDSERFRFDSAFFPVDILDRIEVNTDPDHVFNEMAWGGYILYERPDIPVFIDGQTDFYGERLSRDYLRIMLGAEGWRDLLDRYSVNWTLTRPAVPIVQLLDLDPEWEPLYRDAVAVVMYRTHTRSASPTQ